MRVEQLGLAGAYLFHGASHADDRGSFDRLVDFGLFTDLGIDPTVAQASTAHNARRGTVRGLHYQVEPHGEAKTLWCQSGSIYDVLVDLRETEQTFGSWVAVELSAREPTALHVPRGVAHGYQTTAPNTSVTYLISTPHSPSSAMTINWQDPTLAIPWPLDVTAISAHDANAPFWPSKK